MYAYIPAIWPPLLGATFLAAMSLYSWRRRDVPAALPFSAQTSCACLFLLSLALQAGALTPEAKIAWYKVGDASLLGAATLGTCFVLEYAWPGRWLTRRNLVLLSIPLLFHVLLLVVGDARFVWRSVLVGPDGSITTVPALENVLLTAYGMVLVLVNATALIWLFIRSPQHRWPVALILFAQVANRVLFLVSVTRLPRFAPVDPLILGALLTWIMYAVALFGFRIFDPLPIARTAALEQMRDGMIVFDPHWRVAGINHAAAAILSTPAARARGKLLPEILPACGDAADGLAKGEPGPAEISLGVGADLRDYALDLASLHDFRNLPVGHLLLLHDVTEQKRAQAQLLEQQAASAMLKERDRLARELHDELAQVLAFVKLQAQAARDQLASDHQETADEYLAQLIGAAQEAHTDVREYILGARSTPGAQFDLLLALREYLRQFQASYGIRTELIASPGLTSAAFEPVVQAQLMRIVQEALTNVRKHASAACVQVRFDRADGRAQVTILDDGTGFDPGMQATGGGQHYGLGFMRERALEMAGSLAIVSGPDRGTQVVVDVPLRE